MIALPSNQVSERLTNLSVASHNDAVSVTFLDGDSFPRPKVDLFSNLLWYCNLELIRDRALGHRACMHGNVEGRIKYTVYRRHRRRPSGVFRPAGLENPTNFSRGRVKSLCEPSM